MMLLLAIILLFAVATGEGVLYRVSYFLTLVLVASYIYLRLKTRRLAMGMPSKSYVVQVGETLKAHIYLRNDSKLETGWVEIVLMSNMPGSGSGVVTEISARGQERLEIHTPCYARGIYTIGPVLARTSDPLGLFRWEIVEGEPVKVAVQPPIIGLPYFRLPVAEQSGEEGIRHHSQTRTTHVATIREYIHGDSLNQIHWLSTAKSRQLMSKEFDSGRGGDAWIVLDLAQEVHHSQGTERSDEYAVTVAASLTNSILREEHAAGLIACGDREYLVPLGGGAKQMSRILETLTLSKTEGADPLARVLAKNARQLGRSGSLIVITPSTAIDWIAILQELRCRNIDIVTVLVDPTSFGAKESLDPVVLELTSTGIPAYVVRRGDVLSYALSRPITTVALPVAEHHGTAVGTRTCDLQRNGDVSSDMRAAGRPI
jgi:uncharacterized protein (DUF58 family)